MSLINVAPLDQSGMHCNNANPIGEKQQDCKKTYENEPYRTLYPMLLTMKMFGMYYLDETTFKNTPLSRISLGYCMFVLITIWSYFGMNILGLTAQKDLDEIIKSALFIIWIAYCSCQGTAAFLMCFLQRGWREFLTKYRDAEEGLWRLEGHIYLKKRVPVYVITCWIAIISNGGFTGYILFTSNEFDYLSIFSFGNDITQIMILKGLAIFSQIWLSAAWIIPAVVSVMINDLVATNFRCFNAILAEEAKSSPDNIQSHFHRIRDMHKRLVNQTDTVDTLFSSIAAMAIIFNVSFISCNLYVQIYVPYKMSGAPGTITQMFWLITSFLIMFVNTGTCAWLKEEVSNLSQ